MNKNAVFYFCLAIIQLIIHNTSGFIYLDELYGKPCSTQNGTAGVYRKTRDCPPTNAAAGQTTTEARIACCPLIDLDRSGDTGDVRTAFAACEKYELEKLVSRVFDGAQADEYKFPYVAALGYDNTQGGINDNPIIYKCTGVLISFRYVLTPAHCVSNANNEVPVTVRLGSPDLKTAGNLVQDILVSRVIVHPNYTSTVNSHDIALLRLQKLAKRSINVNPICVQKIPAGNITIDNNTFLVTVGLSGSSASNNLDGRLIKSTNTSLVHSDVCKASAHPKFPTGLKENMFCALDSNWSDCQAQISGPMVLITSETETVIGIQTFRQTCNGFTPDVYISVYPYLDWIELYAWPQKKKASQSTGNSTSIVEASTKEGTECTMKSGAAGIYKKFQACPSRIAETGGKTAKTEIVCCPLSTLNRTGIRANAVCREYGTDADDERKPNGTTVNTGLSYHIFGRADEFPYMAALGYENTFGETDDPLVYNCGGALISTHYVLTTAHCVSNIQNQVPIKVRLGSTDLKSTGGNVQEIAVSKIIVHPQWKRSVNYNDIALLRLAKPAKLSSSVKPVCLQTKPLPKLQNNNDTSIVIIGFRGSDDDDRSANKLMKTANISLVPTNICNGSYTGFGRLRSGLDNNMICALDSNYKSREDGCFVEVLGPLLMISKTTQTVIGVPSFGQGCNGPVPDVYTSVYSYLDWIETHVWPEQDQA